MSEHVMTHAPSLRRLELVHRDLRLVAKYAYSTNPPGIDFIVTEGMRSRARQAQLVAAGASWTMNGRHLTGHAIDLAVRVNGKVRWDWPLYDALAVRMKETASILRVPMDWGGDWKGRKRDGPHFQLSWKAYPA